MVRLNTFLQDSLQRSLSRKLLNIQGPAIRHCLQVSLLSTPMLLAVYHSNCLLVFHESTTICFTHITPVGKHCLCFK